MLGEMFKTLQVGTSLGAQWLRLCASTAKGGGVGWGGEGVAVRFLVWELRSYKLCSVAKKNLLRSDSPPRLESLILNAKNRANWASRVPHS